MEAGQPTDESPGEVLALAGLEVLPDGVTPHRPGPHTVCQEEPGFVRGEPGVVEVDGVGAGLRDGVRWRARQVAEGLLEDEAVGGIEVRVARVALVGWWV